VWYTAAWYATQGLNRVLAKEFLPAGEKGFHALLDAARHSEADCREPRH
jgi:hypothetical protein